LRAELHFIRERQSWAAGLSLGFIVVAIEKVYFIASAEDLYFVGISPSHLLIKGGGYRSSKWQLLQDILNIQHPEYSFVFV
jgi:hypothetical protein